MKQFLLKLWQDEEGGETAEWLVVVALITTVAVTLYTGVLQDTLTDATNYIDTTVTGATTGAAVP